MYRNSYFAPSGLCQNKTTFLQYWEIISLASLHTISCPFSAGPVLLMGPPCCRLQGNSAFAGHFFSSIPANQLTETSLKNGSLGKNCNWRSDCAFLKYLVVLGTRFLAGACWAPSESLLHFGIPSRHSWLLDSSEILCWREIFRREQWQCICSFPCPCAQHEHLPSHNWGLQKQLFPVTQLSSALHVHDNSPAMSPWACPGAVGWGGTGFSCCWALCFGDSENMNAQQLTSLSVTDREFPLLTSLPWAQKAVRMVKVCSLSLTALRHLSLMFYGPKYSVKQDI